MYKIIKNYGNCGLLFIKYACQKYIAFKIMKKYKFSAIFTNNKFIKLSIIIVSCLGENQII
jgi:hypothetical protein